MASPEQLLGAQRARLERIRRPFVEGYQAQQYEAAQEHIKRVGWEPATEIELGDKLIEALGEYHGFHSERMIAIEGDPSYSLESAVFSYEARRRGSPNVSYRAIYTREGSETRTVYCKLHYTNDRSAYRSKTIGEIRHDRNTGTTQVKIPGDEILYGAGSSRAEPVVSAFLRVTESMFAEVLDRADSSYWNDL